MPLTVPPGSGWANAWLRWAALPVILLVTVGCLPLSGDRAEAPAASKHRAALPSARVPVHSGQDVLPVESDDPVWGAEHAPVTLIVFLDFQCPYCASTSATLKALRQLYGPERLRIAIKHTPLDPSGRGLAAAAAAQAVFDLAGSDAFFEFEQILFENPYELTDENFVIWAEEVGLKARLFRRAYEDPRTMERVLHDAEVAGSLGIEAVPAFLINGRPLLGARPLFSFQALIDEELEAGTAALLAGFPKGQLYALRVLQNLLGPNAVLEVVKDNGPERWRVELLDSPALGSDTPLVTVVEFVDLQCPFCANAQNRVQRLLEDYPGQVRVVFKHNPLSFHSQSMLAAQIALEARRQRGDAAFWHAVGLLLTRETLSEPQWLAVGQQLGLDTARLSEAVRKESHRSLIERDQDLAVDLGVEGAPVYFVNGRRVENVTSYARLKRVVAEELKAARKLIKTKRATREGVYAALMRQARAPGLPQRADISPPGTDHPTRGSPAAPIVIQMFANHECDSCAEVLTTLDSLERAFPGKLRIVWRYLPDSVDGPRRLGARAALEARAQRGDAAFWRMSALMYEDHSPQSLSRRAIESYARRLGLDMARFRSALNDERHDSTISADFEASRQLSQKAGPVFVVNGYLLRGKPAARTFARVIRLALKDLRSASR